jgi:rhodanese-related sulfurtransferase
MTAPFYKFGLFGDEASLIIAFLIGIAFGFFLERAGFGNARKLAAQFYLTDLSVLKVMFTAIITAMTGLYILSRAGFVDLSMVYLVPTFVLPQIAGGLLLGIGFVIGGYCPGTSCVSAATGRIDGIVYLAGMIAGLVGFGEVYPLVQNFVHLTPMGQITLPALFHVSYGLLVFAVVLMALGAFVAAEWAEKKFGGHPPVPAGSLAGPPWRLTPVRWLALGLALAGFGAALAGSPYRGNQVSVDTRDLALRAGRGDTVSASRLADWIIQGRDDFTLVDLRSPADFAAYHIPGARNVPLAALAPDFAPRTEKIVLCSADGTQAAQAWFLLQAQGFRSVYLLDGGLGAWRSNVLFPAQSPGRDPASFARQSQVAKFFGGTPRIAGAEASASPAALPKLAPPALPALPPNAAAANPPKKKKEGC